MKKLHIFSILLALLITCPTLVLPVAPKAQALQSNIEKSELPTLATEADFVFRTQNNRIFITQYIGTAKKIIIPETINGYPVFSIIPKAFSNSEITYIKLPASLNVIGNNALNECDSLTRIDVADDNPFFCSVDGVVYNKEKTQLKIFPAGRSGDFLIPKNVTSIASFAFYRCYQLENINMYNSVTTIGERAFSFCWNLKSIRLSDTLKTIDKMAFSHCNDLTKIYLPESITSIGTDAFLGKINSNDSSKEYYFVDGIYARKGSYPAKLIKSLGLDYIDTPPIYTNVETGVTVIDTNNQFPDNTELRVDIHPLSSIDADLSGIRYTDGLVVDLYLYSGGQIFVPNCEVQINFDSVSEKLIPTATRVFSSRVGEIELLTERPSIITATYNTDALGTFIVLLSNDFSLQGDVNGDGVITITDARIALLASVNIITLTSEQKIACDVVTTGDDNGVITTADARKLLRTAAKLK